jgi:hypothetical protein
VVALLEVGGQDGKLAVVAAVETVAHVRQVLVIQQPQKPDNDLLEVGEQAERPEVDDPVEMTALVIVDQVEHVRLETQRPWRFEDALLEQLD